MFLYKNPDTSKKARQFALSFLKYKNPDTLCYATLHEIFEIGAGREAFLGEKNFALKFYMQKTSTFCYVYIYKNWTLCVTLLYAKKNALYVTFLYLKFIV